MSDRPSEQVRERAEAVINQVWDEGMANGVLLLDLAHDVLALLTEKERLEELLRRVEPELAPNHDLAEELSAKFGLATAAPLIKDIRTALAHAATEEQT